MNSNTTTAKMDEAAMKLLKQHKQTLRKYIRSNIKSTYPPSTSTTSTSTSTTNELLTSRSNSVFTKLFTLPQFTAAKSIGFFLSMPNYEIQTRNAISRIVKDGKVLYVPKVGLDFEECDMDLIRCDTSTSTSAASSTLVASSADNKSNGDEEDTMFYDNWPRNKWGIPEPPLPPATSSTSTNDVIAKPGDIDLLIVPGLAFDSNGHRLGQGKGYYDRFIAKMRCQEEKKKPLLVGVCLEEQFLDEVPNGLDLGSSTKGVDGGSSSGTIIPISDHDYLMDMVITPSKIYDHTSRR